MKETTRREIIRGIGRAISAGYTAPFILSLIPAGRVVWGKHTVLGKTKFQPMIDEDNFFDREVERIREVILDSLGVPRRYLIG